MMRLVAFVVVVALSALVIVPLAQAKVVNENTDDLPPGCDAVAGDETIRVEGGRDPALDHPGVVYTFSTRSWDLPACTRVTVTFENTDDVRHQFMVHGTWPSGFFQIEVPGKGEETGTFILSGEPASLLVHCGVPQHQQKGMKAQVLVDGGVGDLPNIVGISGLPEDRAEESAGATALLAVTLVLVGLWVGRWRSGR